MLKSTILVIFATLLVVSGCSMEGPNFHVNEELVLQTKVNEEERQFESVYTYEIERPVVVRNEGFALVFEFPPSFDGAKVTAEADDTTLVSAVLDGGFAAADSAGVAGNVGFAIPVSPGVKFESFALSYGTGNGSNSPVLPLSVGFGPTVEGVYFEPAARKDTRIAVRTDIGNPHRTLTFDLSRITHNLRGIAGVAINYAFIREDDTECSVSITAQNAGRKAEFNLNLREGEKSVYLYEGICGFVPAVVRVTVEGAGFTLKSVVTEEISRNSGAGITPIPIDLGGLAAYAMSRWRNPEFELFSWNRFPEILVFDFVSYAVQSEFFKRLAFFVEKAGTAGRLMPDNAIADRHGWNAHDYRAEDLARFFSRAQTEDFELGDKEILLRDILASRGVIRQTGDVWKAGKGGLITVSQESSPRLRRLFLAHEGYHGIFFTDPEYRDVSLAAWNELSQLEQSFWKEFLALRGYNVYDEFLVVNEFQAYLMQVSHEILEAYYWDYSLPALVEALPRTAVIVDQLRTSHPDTFHKSALVIEAYLQETYGFGASDLFCIELLE